MASTNAFSERITELMTKYTNHQQLTSAEVIAEVGGADRR